MYGENVSAARNNIESLKFPSMPKLVSDES